jgi:hypothetical protein
MIRLRIVYAGTAQGAGARVAHRPPFFSLLLLLLPLYILSFYYLYSLNS